MKLATAAQMRELDRQAIEERGIPSIDLMDTAAAGVARAALELLPMRLGKCRAAVFCGSGNNGGDGIAAARLLFMKGVHVRAFLVGNYEKLTPDAREETRRLSECGVELEMYDPEDIAQSAFSRIAHVIIDAIFGVGLSREITPESKFGRAVSLINECAAPVVAADIASGVETDTGRILGCAVKADKTITFTFKKVGQAVGDGALYSGEVEVLDIGIPEDLKKALVCKSQTVEKDFVRETLPERKADGHKGDFGKLLVVGGSVGYTGAPYLTASAAVRSGTGLVFLGVPKSIWAVEAAKCVSAMPFPLEDDAEGMLTGKALDKIEEKLKTCHVLAIGPGLGRTRKVQRLVWDILHRTERPVVLDADGISALAGHMDVLDARKGRVTILTPHDGEFSRIGGDLSHGDRVKAARDFAVQHGCVLVLKGHRTVIATPEGNTMINTTGNAGLARGGSGDVLTGIIAALLAQKMPPAQAAAAGVWIHGRAGDIAAGRYTQRGMDVEDVVACLSAVFKELE